MGAEDNMRLMQTLDDAWNTQDWGVFDQRHAPDATVYWPGKAEPTRGRAAHHAEALEMFRTFPDNRLENRPYKVLFASGDWTCSIARFTGTMTGPMRRGDADVPPTGRSFAVDFCTVAHWRNGQIIEENLFYDLADLLQQIGVSA